MLSSQRNLLSPRRLTSLNQPSWMSSSVTLQVWPVFITSLHLPLWRVKSDSRGCCLPVLKERLRLVTQPLEERLLQEQSFLSLAASLVISWIWTLVEGAQLFHVAWVVLQHLISSEEALINFSQEVLQIQVFRERQLTTSLEIFLAWVLPLLILVTFLKNKSGSLQLRVKVLRFLEVGH